MLSKKFCPLFFFFFIGLTIACGIIYNNGPNSFSSPHTFYIVWTILFSFMLFCCCITCSYNHDKYRTYSGWVETETKYSDGTTSRSTSLMYTRWGRVMVMFSIIGLAVVIYSGIIMNKLRNDPEYQT